MVTCPQCGKEYSDSSTGCPSCTSHPARYGPEHDLHLVSVYPAQDETSAHLVHGALVGNGVPAYIHSEQAPMFGTILEVDRGCWGEVMVPENYRDRALEVIGVYTTETPEAAAALEQEALAAEPEDAPAH
nr:DUF2007 domain-containing protein [Armatimonadota bacterium]